MRRLTTNDEVRRFVSGNPAALVYFSGPDCGVCSALKPRLGQWLTEEFPELPGAEVDCAANPEAAAQHGVFVVPTVIVWFDGRETLRRSRAFGLGELQSELERPYALLFES